MRVLVGDHFFKTIFKFRKSCKEQHNRTCALVVAVKFGTSCLKINARMHRVFHYALSTTSDFSLIIDG